MFGVPQSVPQSAVQPRVEVRPLLKQIYMWMTLGLLVTTGVSVAVYNIPAVLQVVMNPAVFMVAIIGELALVFGLSLAIRKLSAGVAIAMFFVYAALNGFTLSLIFLGYELGSIAAAFGTTVVLFFVMTMIGLTTNIDLQKYRTYFLMAIIGLVIAMVINMFIGSGPLDYLISFAGVIIFTALTAYDTQKFYRMAADPTIQGEEASLLTKLSIIGALTLYLDFINLFLFLLRLFGGRRH
ncbi:MAG: Bax inhibitor-1/YccA family protein [Anaerolineae bacterium]|nr:Bax inhibitor-1/YccA family protein [Anaerolineae bacterium]